MKFLYDCRQAPKFHLSSASAMRCLICGTTQLETLPLCSNSGWGNQCMSMSLYYLSPGIKVRLWKFDSKHTSHSASPVRVTYLSRRIQNWRIRLPSLSPGDDGRPETWIIITRSLFIICNIVMYVLLFYKAERRRTATIDQERLQRQATCLAFKVLILLLFSQVALLMALPSFVALVFVAISCSCCWLHFN